MPLHVGQFGGGISIDGSADSQKTNEVQAADSYDISSRGLLITASDLTDYLELDDDGGAPAAWTALWAILEAAGFNFSKVIAVGEGQVAGLGNRYVMTSFAREGEVSPLAWGVLGQVFGQTGDYALYSPLPQGVVVTGAEWAGIVAWRPCTYPAGAPTGIAVQGRVYLLNIGAREGTAPNLAPGLFILFVPNTATPPIAPIPYQMGKFDTLGTGSSGLLSVPQSINGGEGNATGGNNASQLYPRVIAVYNNHLFIAGYDKNDDRVTPISAITNANPAAVTCLGNHGLQTGDQVRINGVGGMTQINTVAPFNTYTVTVTGLNTFTVNGVDSTAFGAYTSGGFVIRGSGDGPGKLMFSNLGLPTKFGNDNVSPVGTNRIFTDSDAINIGDAGEIIRALIVWGSRLFIGTSRGLHYVAGFGRDSFISDGSTPIMRSYNVIGPKAIIEGPDKLLYGVCEQGLWVFDGDGVPLPLFQGLRDFKGRSNGYWDLIWTDLSRSATTYPGVTNQDLVWMAIDWERQQVLIGIPWCSIANGYGYGTDTVVIKYHVQTRGFTRQQFPGVQYTAAGYFRAVSQQPSTRMFGTPTAGTKTVRRYGYKANNNGTPVLPSRLPTVGFGPYVPFGADGRGEVARLYLTMAWDPFTPLVINAISNANPCAVTTTTPHGLSSGVVVELYALRGMSEVVGGPYTITVTGANTFTLNGVNSTAFSPYVSGGFVGFPFKFLCTVKADEAVLQGNGAGVVSTFYLSVTGAPSRTPQEGDLWVDLSQTDPNLGNATAGVNTMALGGYLVKVRRDNSPVLITGATKANPCVVTAPGHGFSSGQLVSIRDVVGMTQLNNDAGAGPYTKDYSITVVDADHFSIGVDSTAFGVYASGGRAALAWQLVPGMGGKGQRVTIPIPVPRKPGVRYSMDFATVAQGSRHQLEGFGMLPVGGDDA